MIFTGSKNHEPLNSVPVADVRLRTNELIVKGVFGAVCSVSNRRSARFADAIGLQGQGPKEPN